VIAHFEVLVQLREERVVDAEEYMQRRLTFLGFEFYWKRDRKGQPRVMRRTARQKLQAACRRITEWIKRNRHLPGIDFIKRLNARLRGHYKYCGIRGNSRSISRFFKVAIECVLKWRNRRGGKRNSFTWKQFNRVIDRFIAKPRIT